MVLVFIRYIGRAVILLSSAVNKNTNMIIKLKAPKIGVKQAIIRVFCLTVNMQKKERCSGTLNG